MVSPKLKPYLARRIEHSRRDVIPAGQGAAMETATLSLSWWFRETYCALLSYNHTLLCCDPTTGFKPSPDNVPLVWAARIQPADLQLLSVRLKKKKGGSSALSAQDNEACWKWLFTGIVGFSHGVDHRHTSARRNEGSSHTFVESFAYCVGLNKRAKGHRLK